MKGGIVVVGAAEVLKIVKLRIVNSRNAQTSKIWRRAMLLIKSLSVTTSPSHFRETDTQCSFDRLRRLKVSYFDGTIEQWSFAESPPLLSDLTHLPLRFYSLPPQQRHGRLGCK